jgi:Lamin Tail Domain
MTILRSIIILAAFWVGCPILVSAQPPQLLVSELMINPTVGKDKGTWFELYNPSNKSLDLSNRTLRLGNYDTTVGNTFGCTGLRITDYQIPVGYSIPPKQYFVLGNNNDRSTNGNIPVDYVYSPHVPMPDSLGLVALTMPNNKAVTVISVLWGIYGNLSSQRIAEFSQCNAFAAVHLHCVGCRQLLRVGNVLQWWTQRSQGHAQCHQHVRVAAPDQGTH